MKRQDLVIDTQRFDDFFPDCRQLIIEEYRTQKATHCSPKTGSNIWARATDRFTTATGVPPMPTKLTDYYSISYLKSRALC